MDIFPTIADKLLSLITQILVMTRSYTFIVYIPTFCEKHCQKPKILKGFETSSMNLS